MHDNTATYYTCVVSNRFGTEMHGLFTDQTTALEWGECMFADDGGFLVVPIHPRESKA